MVKMVKISSSKIMDNGNKKTTGLYKIAANIIKKVKSGSSYKTQLYQAQYPNKLLLNAVLMNVFKWEKVIDVLIDKSNILEKEQNMDPDLLSVLITEMMWSKFGLKGDAKNIVAVKKYKDEFVELMKDDDLKKISCMTPQKGSKPRYFRINTLLTSLKDVLKNLSTLGFKKLETPKTYVELLELIQSDKFIGNKFVQDIHIKELLIFNSKVKFYKFQDYNDGSLIIQDKASCLASYLLNPKPQTTVLDMCAAPGMKTSHLAAIMQNKGTLYAVDRCKERYNTLNNMMEKYGVKCVETFNMDALSFPYYDDVKYILLDPSCSGSGIVDRVRNDLTGQNEHFQMRLKKLANVHAQLLNHALKSPNLERLVYSTCSKNPEENEAVVDEALSVNGKFKLLDCTKIIKGWTNKGAPGYDCSNMCLNAIPDVDCTNGFFIAVFVRRDSEDKDEEINDWNMKIEEEILNELNTEVKNEKNEEIKKVQSFKKTKSMKKEISKDSIEVNESNIKVENEKNEDEPAKKSKSIKRKKTKDSTEVNESNIKVENEKNEDEPAKKSKSMKRKKTKDSTEIIESNINVENEKYEDILPAKKSKLLNIISVKTDNKIVDKVNELSIKTVKNIENVNESSTKIMKNKCEIEKKKNKVVVPMKITKAMKRRIRKLKLDTANGKTTVTSKKLKKTKAEKT